MACLGCSCSTGKDSVGGCGSNGGCSSGGCNRHNTYDWITALGIADSHPFDVVEVSFKNGSRKEFFKNPAFTRATTGDHVVVEAPSGGYDVGIVTLSGELVRLQMKRKRVREDARLSAVIRKAHDRDMERLDELRKQEKEVMVKARAIARSIELNMKVCDIEFQGDGRKCTFFYTADGRVDFRELIRHYAKEFKIKVEMRQIGARQESARIGGLGNCGRELCCSTWLTEFKSVNTAAARYQNLAINQTKLSGMCGRLKCCLNYELDTYIDALEDFPDKADRLKTKAGLAVLVKTDVFKRLMFYAYADNRIKFYPLHVDQVWDAMDMIKNGTIPGSLDDILAMAPPSEEVEDEEPDFENVDNVLQLPLEKRKKKKKKKKKGRGDTAAAAVERAEQVEQQRPSRSGGRTGGPRPDNRNRSENGDRRGPSNRTNEGSQQQRPEGERRGPNPNRPPRKEGDNPNRGPQQSGEGNQRPRPEGERRGPNPNRPPRPDGASPTTNQDGTKPRQEGERRGPNPNRPPKPEGEQTPRPPRTEGNGPQGEGRPPSNPNGSNRPPNRNKNKNKPKQGPPPTA
ncbi:MAG: regulatory iron-sulfur-containing complex subunit RicT [Chitinophagales bacterium]